MEGEQTMERGQTMAGEQKQGQGSKNLAGDI